MRTLRTIAVGLVVGAALDATFARDFVLWASQQEFFVVQQTTAILQPNITSVIASPILLPAAFLLACVGAGLFAASIFWAMLEDGVSLIGETIGLLAGLAGTGIARLVKRFVSRRGSASV